MLVNDQYPAIDQCSHRVTELLGHHLRDFETFLGTVATSLGTSGHFLVIRQRLAGSRTLVTTLRTAQRGVAREGALSGTQRGAHLAALCAVHTQMHALGVLLLPISDESRAVMEARIALHLAIRASRCALLQVCGVRTIRRERGPTHSEQGEGNGTQ